MDLFEFCLAYPTGKAKKIYKQKQFSMETEKKTEKKVEKGEHIECTSNIPYAKPWNYEKALSQSCAGSTPGFHHIERHWTCAAGDIQW